MEGFWVVVDPQHPTDNERWTGWAEGALDALDRFAVKYGHGRYSDLEPDELREYVGLDEPGGARTAIFSNGYVTAYRLPYHVEGLQACEPSALYSLPGVISVELDEELDSMGFNRATVHGRSRDDVVDYVRRNWGNEDTDWFREYVVEDWSWSAGWVQGEPDGSVTVHEGDYEDAPFWTERDWKEG